MEEKLTPNNVANTGQILGKAKRQDKSASVFEVSLGSGKNKKILEAPSYVARRLCPSYDSQQTGPSAHLPLQDSKSGVKPQK